MTKWSRLFCAALLVLLHSGCETFTTHACGDAFLHVYYGGGVGGYRVVILNDRPTMRFVNPEAIFRYIAEDEDDKVVFQNDNPIRVTCGNPITFTADALPDVDTFGERTRTMVTHPAEVRDVERQEFDLVIR